MHTHLEKIPGALCSFYKRESVDCDLDHGVSVHKYKSYKIKRTPGSKKDINADLLKYSTREATQSIQAVAIQAMMHPNKSP